MYYSVLSATRNFDWLPGPPAVNPPLRHATGKVVASAVVLLQVVEFGICDDAQRREVRGVDGHRGPGGFERLAVKDDKLHELIQSLPVPDTKRVGRGQ